MKKKKVLSVLLFSVMLLTACDKYQINEGQINNNNLFPDYEYNQEKEQGIYGHSEMAVAENGYYYILSDILYFYNINSDINMPLCSKANCKHKDENCDAYVSAIDTTNGGTFECNCMGYKVMYYNEHVYCIEVTKDRDYYLYQYDSAFSNRQCVTRLASAKDELMAVIDAQSCMISEGYLYYYTTFLDPEYVKNDCMAQFYACRIKLEDDSSREVLGEFQFPGDYAAAAGDSNGLAVYLSDNNIYFYAGGTGRCYSDNNIVQYRVSKYNPDTNEYMDIWTYTGNDRSDVFGEGTVADLATGGEYVKSDSEGNFYMMISTTEDYYNMIIKVNFDNHTHEVIYKTELKELYSLQSDGEYLYFFESTEYSDATRSYLTAIDLNGTVKAQHEMEYDEKYLKELESSSQKIRDSAVFILVHGLDERYILLSCPARVNSFKNLTTPHAMKITPETKIYPTTSAGVINKTDFLNGNNVSVKQIYQYAP